MLHCRQWGQTVIRTVSAAQDIDQLRLAEAICARLCHDLSGPLGTVLGALEMVAEEPESSPDALPLASEAALSLGHRLRLLRAAWAGDCGPMAPADLSQLAAGLPPRVRIDLQGLHPSPFDPAGSRVLANLLLLGTEALPRGGLVSLSGAPGSDVALTVDGPSAAWPTILPNALADPYSVSLDSPRALQAPLTVILARTAGFGLFLEDPPGSTPGLATLRLTPI
jgi:histidine phosphotransferase ChpT